MKKIYLLLIGISVFLMPLVVKASTCTNCIALDNNQSATVGGEASFDLSIYFNSDYAGKIKKIEYTVVVDDTTNSILKYEEAKYTVVLNNWLRDITVANRFMYTKGTSITELVSGSQITNLKFYIKSTAVAGSVVNVTITNVKMYYEEEDSSNPGSLVEKTIESSTPSSKSITIKDAASSSVTKSNVALLASLITSQGTLSPIFDANNEVYNIALKDTVAKVTLTAACQQNCSALSASANGTSIGSSTNGSLIKQITLVKNELTTIKLTIISQDGMNAKNYTINITRGEVVNDSANLSSLTTDSGSLTPSFDPNVLEYTVNVDSSTTSIDFDYKLANTEATSEVVGGSNLVMGENIVKIVVTSSDTVTVKTYIITVNRSDQLSSSDMLSSSNIVITSDNNKMSTKTLLLIMLIIFGSLAIIGIAFYLIFKRKKETKHINSVLSKDDNPDVTISHDNDVELLELTREFNIGKEINNRKND